MAFGLFAWNDMVVTACLPHTGTPAEAKLAQLASGCAAVVVCRASPSQKAAIVRRMKRFRIEQCEVHLFVARAVIRSAQFLSCHLSLELQFFFMRRSSAILLMVCFFGCPCLHGDRDSAKVPFISFSSHHWPPRRVQESTKLAHQLWLMAGN